MLISVVVMETVKLYISVQMLIYDPVIFSAFRDKKERRSEIFVGHLLTTVTCVWRRASCRTYQGLPFVVVVDML